MFVKNWVKESQEVWGWNGLLEVIESFPTAQEGLPELVAQDHVQVVFEYCQQLESLQPLWETCPSAHSKKMFPDVQVEPPVFQFVPVALCLVTKCYSEEVGSIILISPY